MAVQASGCAPIVKAFASGAAESEPWPNPRTVAFGITVPKALGDKFNIRAFHDTVLELGSVPLPVLEARIDRFIAEGGKGPYPDME